MTTQNTTITSSKSGMFAVLSRATAQYFKYRAQKARLVSDMKALLVMDSHMLNDIGLKGFNRLPPAQQKSLLHDKKKYRHSD